MLREKILKYMSLTSVAFEQNIDGITEQFKTAFGAADGLSPEAEEAVRVISDKLKERVSLVEDQVIAIYEQHLTEEDFDALIAWHESPVAKKLAACAPMLQEQIGMVTGNWFQENLQIVEPEWQRLLGTPSEGAPADAAVAAEAETSFEPPTAA